MIYLEYGFAGDHLPVYSIDTNGKESQN
jgi:hypothetical protein